jgi:hypothetical protein
MSSRGTNQSIDNLGRTPYRAPELYTQVSHKYFMNDLFYIEEGA